MALNVVESLTVSELSFRAHVMAVDRVEKRLRRTAQALDAAGIKYAVIGGNAVAAWVGRVDPSATRATRDVDILVRRSDEDRIAQALAGLGFVWAEELVQPSYACPAPSVDEAVRDPEGFWVLDLPALVRMKLTSNRDIDRVHIADLLDVGLIGDSVRDALPSELLKRLDDIQRSVED